MSDAPPEGQQQVQQPQFALLPQNNSLFASNAMDGFDPSGAAEGLSDMYGSSNLGGSTANHTHDVSGAETLTDMSMTGSFMMNTSVSDQEKQDIIRHIDELKYAEKRDNALLELSRQREHFSELAPFIWHSVGTIAALLQEIVSVYPLLSPPLLDSKTSNKACNVLALLQCVASHKDTRPLFLRAHITLFLYPFLNTVSKGRSFEYLRLTSLGVVGALVKVDDSEVISFLLQTEIIPLCLRIMERGTDLSQTVATFIIQKILMDNEGLKYLCATAERFFAVSTVLNNMVDNQLVKPSTRLLKHIIKCYFRLSENPRAQMALNTTMPTIVKEMLNENKKLTDNLDDSSKKLLSSLIETLQLSSQRNSGQLGGGSSPDDLTAGAHLDEAGNPDPLADFNAGKGHEHFDQMQTQQFQRQLSQQQSPQQIHPMGQRPLSSNHAGQAGFIHPGNGQVMQNLMMQNGNPQQQRQMSSTSMPFAAAQAMQRPQPLQSQGSMRGEMPAKPFGGPQPQPGQTGQSNYMFQGRGGVVTSPRLTGGQPGQPQPSQQLNYMPQPGGQAQSRTSPPPTSQHQPAFMHQFQHANSMPNQFGMMPQQFNYQMQQQQRQQSSGQPAAQQPPQYAQRQTSPNVPPQGASGTQGNAQNNFFF